MAGRALLALLAREEYKAGKAGRSNAGLRVVNSAGERKSVWGPRRDAGVKMRVRIDENMVLGPSATKQAGS